MDEPARPAGLPAPRDEIAGAVETLLRMIGEDPHRDGLRETPARVAAAWAELTSGYAEDPAAILSAAVLPEPCRDLVLVRDVEFHSLCEHHLLPFRGVAHLAYLPAGRLVGLSKMARAVEAVARRLQVQERMTQQLSDAIGTALQPLGSAVIVEAEHMCMAMRGVSKPGTRMITSSLRGVLQADGARRDELFALLGKRP